MKQQRITWVPSHVGDLAPRSCSAELDGYIAVVQRAAGAGWEAEIRTDTGGLRATWPTNHNGIGSSLDACKRWVRRTLKAWAR